MAYLTFCPECGRSRVSSEGRCPNSSCRCNIAMSLKHKYDGREAVKGLYPCPLCKTDNEITIFENGKVFSEYCVSCGHPIAETAPEFPRYLRDAVPIEITELLAAAESTGK